jgi:muconolactone D-isomerase
MPGFLVQIDVAFPADMPTERRDELIALERVHGRALRQRRIIRRIWRLPGGLRNVGVWEAGDVRELRAHIAELPLSPWMRVAVTELAPHPLELDDPTG